MTSNQVIKNLRLNSNMSQAKLGKLLSVDQATVSKLESGEQKITEDMLKKYSQIFNVSVEYILGNNKSNKKDYFILGDISCGNPIIIQEDYENSISLPFDFIQYQDVFCLNIKGDSMINAGINNADIVFIKKQDYIDHDGDIMAVIINNDECTIKRIFKHNHMLELRPENPSYKSVFINHNDIYSVKIIGKVVGILSKNVKHNIN